MSASHAENSTSGLQAAGITKPSFEIHNPADGILGFVVWPPEDKLRLLEMVGHASGVAPLLATCTKLWHQLWRSVGLLRECQADERRSRAMLEAQAAFDSLEIVLNQTTRLVQMPILDAIVTKGIDNIAMPEPQAWRSSVSLLDSLEVALHTSMRYVYSPDWEVRAGRMISKKGTWLKTTTKFSWEVSEPDEKIYIPQGVAMPVIQIGHVTDPEEIVRHDWTLQHLVVWLKPSIVETLKRRADTWYVYYPHFYQEDVLTITAQVDTWFKRSCQMSGEMQPFELIYVPRGVQIKLACPAEVVDEEWEKTRHGHIASHRKVTFASPPLKVRQGKYEIFVSQEQ